ncbi:hypothetical protein HYPSUDRAFT_72425 [Hypholoma sublateritium FD-334 SS-4]|uniref:Ubiquinone biosynthesis protein n=1 Tax=Hypholoma sublateritium (strain FD-334 SS-4) TaxID=945553 RepID=A0A0D2N6H7_HYPSF|nr:hypothetical protein HYPSUDRAFT_72425 [Hypholoma sublateritium FD-334 SS-4]
MASQSSSRLLKLALPLVKTHGFTREALSRSVLTLPSNEQHAEPLSDSAITALFGRGDFARRTLIDAWLEDGLAHMASESSDANGGATPAKKATIRDVLRARLKYNEPVLAHLPDAFGLMASSGFHVVDPLPVLEHAARIADRACYTTGDRSLQLEWYAKRASVAAVYAAAELHQLTSPHTTYAFLDSLLDSTSNIKATLGEVGLYSEYVFKSWKGIIKSSGILPL